MFSVIIPLYNKEISIKKTVDSILKQSFSDFELIIVNDGSTDNSLAQVEAIKDSRIKILTIPNGGVSNARNFGVSKASFDYISFLDADDTWFLDFLKEMKGLIDDFPNAALWSANHQLNINESFKTYYSGKNNGFRNYFTDYFKCVNENYNTIIWTGTVIMKKEKFDTLGGFDENLSMGEDIDLWFRCALKFPIVFYNKVLAIYRINSENRACDKNHQLTKTFLAKTYKYLQNNNLPSDFKKYLRKYIANNIAPYYFSKDYPEVKHLKSELNKNELSIKLKILFLTPHPIASILFRFKNIMKIFL